jgi:hypothetical protein
MKSKLSQTKRKISFNNNVRQNTNTCLTNTSVSNCLVILFFNLNKEHNMLRIMGKYINHHFVF